MSGYSFLTVVLMDLLLVNQAHLFKLPILAKEEPGRIKFNFSPSLTSNGPAQPSSGTGHVQIPSALVNLSYEGDNYCSEILISEEIVLTAVACLISNQTLLENRGLRFGAFRSNPPP